MRIGVIGAGAVGGTIAALLDGGGHQVEVTARGQQQSAITTGGLSLSGAWGDHIARVQASPLLTGRPQLVFVCTKAQDAASAIEAHRRLIDGAQVVVVQNGLTGLDRASHLLPNSPCTGALAIFAASFIAPGRVRVTTPGPTYLGSGSGAPTDAALAATRILATVMPASATSNFIGCQWTKLIVNQVNAAPAITGLSAQQTIQNRNLRLIIASSMREAVRVGLASGVHFGSIQGLNHAALRAFAAAGTRFGQLLPALMARRMGVTPNPGSTLQSIRRGKRTEIDYLNGAIVDAARRVGTRAPLNAAIVALVHEVEDAGSFLSPAEVVERLAPAVNHG